MSMQIDLSGRTALVTGASRGIGLCIARTLALAGARVAMVARKKDVLAQATREVERSGGQALAVAASTSRDEEVARARDTVADAWGHVDILVNNAATNPHFGPVLEADARIFQATLNTNLLGYFRTAQAFAPGMIAAGGGRIVNVSSIAGHRPAAGLGLYAISKAGVSMLTACLARELGPHNILVNAISPGLVQTDFSRALFDMDSGPDPEVNDLSHASYVKATPLGRAGEAQEVANLALFLASGMAAYANGADIPLDGGYLV